MTIRAVNTKSQQLTMSENRQRRERYFKSLLDRPRVKFEHYAVVAALLIGVLGLSLAAQRPSSDIEPQCQSGPSPGVNWRGCDHPGVQLAGKKMSGASLHSGNFSDGIFSGAQLRGVDAAYGNFGSADLRDSDWQQSSLMGAVLNGANLSGPICVKQTCPLLICVAPT